MGPDRFGNYYKQVKAKTFTWEEVLKLPSCHLILGVCGYKLYGKCANPEDCQIEINDKEIHSFKYKARRILILAKQKI